MPEDFSITLAADVGEFMSGMDSAASSASKSAEAIKESFTDSGVEDWFTNIVEVADSSLAGIEARFEASGAVIRDYADEVKNAGFVEASAAERTVALNQEAQAERAATFAAMRDEFDGTADAQRALAAEVEEASQREVAALKEVEAQAEANALSFGKIKAAFWDLLLVVFAFNEIKGIVTDLTKSQIDLATEIERTAQIMGTSNLEAHAWIDAAQLSGVAANSFTTASRTMNSQVAAGGKQLKEMGISLTDTNGAMKTTGQLIEETIAKLETYSASADRNALAQKTLGRGWIDLVANGQSLIANLKQQEQEMAGTGTAQDTLVATGKQLQAVNAQIDQSWRNLVSASGPALIGLLKAVEESLMAVAANAQVAMIAIEGVFRVASNLGNLAKGISEVTPGGGDLTTDQAALVKGYNDISDAGKGVGDTITDTGKKISDVMSKLAKDRGRLWVDHLKMIQGDLKDAGTGGEGTGTGRSLVPAPPAALPKAGRKGGADPMAGVDDALISSQNQMDKMAAEYSKLSSEAQMSSKASAESFSTLQARAVSDYQTMMDAHKAFADAVQSGDAEAAKASEKDWHDAAQKFQQDWEAAKQKAVQDMQQIKSVADSMASEVSGVLNSALSGKLNWAQEISKIGGQMINELTKYLFQMVALMINHQTMMSAAQTAGQGNMIGSMVNWMAQRLGLEATNNAASLGQHVATETGKATASVTAQATQLSTLAAGLAAQIAAQKGAAAVQGTTDAGVAAANTMAALSGIPIVGPALAAATAPVMFSETLAYSVAEGGFDVPPGVNPMTQLHPREMVLPADIAGGMRQMIASGGGGAGSTSVTQNIHAIDSRSFLDIVDSNHQGIAQAVAKARRGGGRFNTG